MKLYLVESGFGWFVVKARTKRAARSEGIEEYGRGSNPRVSVTTASDIKYYLSNKGYISESDK